MVIAGIPTTKSQASQPLELVSLDSGGCMRVYNRSCSVAHFVFGQDDCCAMPGTEYDSGEELKYEYDGIDNWTAGHSNIFK